jgi:hypothetical protein
VSRLSRFSVDSSLPLVIFESTSASGLNFHVF